MFDFIPLPFYTPLYYHFFFFVALIVFFHSLSTDIRDGSVFTLSNILGYFLLIVLVFYMGLRPVSGVFFGDMSTYAQMFDNIKAGRTVIINKDVLFNSFLTFCAKIMDKQSFFLLMDFLYIMPCYIFSRRYSKNYWFFTFFMLVGSFSFWSYGTNGIRNGLATSLFILGIVFYNKKIIMYAIMALAFGIHSSLIVPISAFVLAGFYKNPKIFLYGWLASIPLSLVAGGAFQSIFAGLFSDARATDYLTKGNLNQDVFSSTGFRWDFVLYSAAAVFGGWYYIYKKNVKDSFYYHIFNTYLIANAFWILIIKANFSNRFAYLSWFMMAIVIAYPIFKYKLWNNHYRVAGIIFFAYYGFTYFMFLKS